MKPVLQFNASHAHTGTDLLSLIQRKEQAVGRCTVADLTLGSWSPRSLASQIFGQILPGPAAPAVRVASLTTDIAESMGVGIDQETRGNRTVLDTITAAKQILWALRNKPSAILVLYPAYGANLRWEDRLLIEYLRSFDAKLDLTLVVTSDSAAPWPAEWSVAVSREPAHATPSTAVRNLASRLPSALSPAQLQALADTDPQTFLALSNGWRVVAPEHRQDPSAPESRFTEQDINDLKAANLHEFLPYATLHGDVAVDSWQMCLHAWAQFGAGYRELAFAYIEFAEKSAADLDLRATLQCQKQSMRIALSQYADAGNEPDPVPGIPDKARAQLLQTKGWGLVMSGNGKAALPYLREALEILKPAQIDTPYLFLMNISALAEVRSGNFDRALELEQAIDHNIQSLGITNARLIFVNSINLARLHRYSGDLDGAERWYRRAFGTVDGARTEFDTINSNLSLARLEEARSDNHAALLCWLRAALSWVASDAPEALTWRVQNLVFGKGGVVTLHNISEIYDLVEKLAGAFLHNLRRYSTAAGLTVEFDPEQYTLCRFESLRNVTTQPAATRYVGAPGWGLAAGNVRTAPRAYGPAFQQLQEWLSAWVATTTGQAGENCYWVDRRHGDDGPTDWDSFINHASDLSLEKLTYEGRSIVLTTEQSGALQQVRQAVLSPIVSDVQDRRDKVAVSFRRYFPTVELTGDDALVLRTLQSEPVISHAKDLLRRHGLEQAAVEAVIARLRNMRVLRIVRPLNSIPDLVYDAQLSLCA